MGGEQVEGSAVLLLLVPLVSSVITNKPQTRHNPKGCIQTSICRKFTVEHHCVYVAFFEVVSFPRYFRGSGSKHVCVCVEERDSYPTDAHLRDAGVCSQSVVSVES